MSQTYKRWDLLNYLIQIFGYKKYLEIGVQSGLCFNYVKCDYKVGVDPDTTSKATIHKTSDDFFKENTEKFDIVFVDGLHEAPQVYKDIVNSLEVINEGGIIVCHDMMPMSYEAQAVPRMQSIWNGNCWEAFVQLRASREDLAMCTIDSDHGLGVIMKGEQELLDLKGSEIDWKGYVANRNEWMNVMSYSDFYTICDSIKK